MIKIKTVRKGGWEEYRKKSDKLEMEDREQRRKRFLTSLRVSNAIDWGGRMLKSVEKNLIEAENGE